MLTTNASRRVDFDDLLDIAAANDVERPAPRLRGLPRWSLRAAVNMESEDNLYAGLSYDVSAGGIFVATIDTPPVGARVELMVTLPDGRELELTGVVRWIRDADIASDGLPAGCGIEWKGLPVHALHALESFAEIRTPVLWLPEAA
ncbi:MAG: cell division protein FtsY [bacterium]|nr:cell division protein FtsY [bacterium]